MSAKKVISFFGASMLSALVVYFSFAILIVSTFSLQGRTLDQLERSQLTYLLFWFSLTALGTSIAYFLWKKKKVFSASGVAIVSIVPIIAAMVMSYKAISTIPTSEEFLSEEWRNREAKSFLMAKSVLQSEMLSGKTDVDVLELLAAPTQIVEQSYSDKMFLYQTDSASWLFRVHLADNKVQECDLYHPGLSK